MKKIKYSIMRSYRLITRAFIFLTLLTSCSKDWLDAKADKSLTVPETLNDFQALLDNIIMNQQFPGLVEIASDAYYVTDPVFSAAVKTLNTDSYFWTKTLTYKEVSAWNQQYSKILIDNIILEGLDKIKPNAQNQVDWNNVKGQAHFNRAMVFFSLAECFSPAFDSQNANQMPGIVLRLSTDIESPSKRSTVQECYTQILNDLNVAKDLLPTTAIVQSRASKTAVFALLSRIYLSMGDYQKCFAASDSCLKLYSTLLDYNNPPATATATYIGRFNKEVIYHANFSMSPFSSSVLVENSLFTQYQVTDLRKSRFFKSNTNGTISFKGNYESSSSLFFRGLATDEIYLTRAECYARAGKTTEAIKDLNDLLITRYEKGKFIPLTATTSDEALQIILTERRKELIFRGTRWSDLRRLNKDPKFAITLKRTVNSKEYTLVPNSPKYVFPIPDDIIQSTGIAQNAGWEL